MSVTMNFYNFIRLQVILQIFLIDSISAPYPKYYISNYCGPLRGSTLQLNAKSSVALLKLKRETYKPNLDCNLTIKAPNNYGVIAYVKRIKLRKYHSLEDSLEVISDNNMTSFKWFGNNEEITPKINVVSNGNRGEIYVVFKSENFFLGVSSKGFKIVLTVFTPVSNGICGQNSSLGFNCANKLCIDNILECDGINNCVNYFDEQNCSETSESMIGLIVFCSTLLVMAILVVVFMCKTDKRKREDIARRLSKACISGGRRLSTMFSTRLSPTPEVLNRYQMNSEDNVYRSVPVIYERTEDHHKCNGLNGHIGHNDHKLGYASNDNLHNSCDKIRDNQNSGQ